MTSKFKPGTLPDHARCTVHRGYKLGCDQYEHLIERSGRRCEICDLPGTRCTRGKLNIDHYGPKWAVRGLLCDDCNTRLSSQVTQARPRWAVEYLDNAWWIRECERLAVSTEIAPEPDFGTAFVDQFRVVWLREGDGQWRPQGRNHPGISSANWQWLYEMRGPHNMVPVDLYAADASAFWQDLVWASERSALRALLAEHSGRDIPLYQTWAYRRMLSAYMS